MPARQPAKRPSKITIFGKKNFLAPRVSQTAVISQVFPFLIYVNFNHSALIKPWNVFNTANITRAEMLQYLQHQPTSAEVSILQESPTLAEYELHKPLLSIMC